MFPKRYHCYALTKSKTTFCDCVLCNRTRHRRSWCSRFWPLGDSSSGRQFAVYPRGDSNACQDGHPSVSRLIFSLKKTQTQSQDILPLRSAKPIPPVKTDNLLIQFHLDLYDSFYMMCSGYNRGNSHSALRRPEGSPANTSQTRSRNKAIGSVRGPQRTRASNTSMC